MFRPKVPFQFVELLFKLILSKHLSGRCFKMLEIINLSKIFIFICSGNQNVPIQTENHVSSYLCSLPPAEVRRAAENLLVRCRACVYMDGGHFEHVLKKYKNRASEE